MLYLQRCLYNLSLSVDQSWPRFGPREPLSKAGPDFTVSYRLKGKLLVTLRSLSHGLQHTQDMS